MKKLSLIIIIAFAAVSFVPFKAHSYKPPQRPIRTANDFMAGKFVSSDMDPPDMLNADVKLRIPKDSCRGGVCAEKRVFDFSVEFDFYSKYVSRGIPFSNGPVWQPSITLQAYNIGLTVWSNFVMNNEPNQGQFNEVDLIPYYNLEWGHFNFIPAVNFILPVNKNPASLNYSTNNVIRPQFHISYSIWKFTPYVDGFYYVYPSNTFGMYHDFGVLFHYDFSETIHLDTYAQVALGAKNWVSPRVPSVGTKLDNFEYALSLSFDVGNNFSFEPVVHVVTTIPKALRSYLPKPDFVWGGLNVKYDM